MAERSGSAVKGNGFDKKLTTLYVTEYEKIEDGIATRKGEYMAWAKGERERQSEVLERAKDSGLPKKDLKDVIKIRQLQGRIDDIVDNEDEERAETIEMIRHALGDLADTPLGQAAEKKATKGKGMPGGDSPGSAH